MAYNKGFQQNNQQSQGSSMNGEGAYLIPSRMVVSRRILDSLFKMNDSFRQLSVDQGNRLLVEECSSWVIQSYLMLMVYSEQINDKFVIGEDKDNNVEGVRPWIKFSNDMDYSISIGKTKWGFQGLRKCVFMLQKAAYHSGITKIEWEKSEIDDIEATRKWKGI